MNLMDLSYFRFLISHDSDDGSIANHFSGADHFKDVLLKAHKFSWGTIDKYDDSSEFKENYNAIVHHKNINTSLIDLFNLYLITDFLLAKKYISFHIKSLIQEYIDLSKYLEIQPELLKNSEWCKIPVIFTGDGEAYIRFFVAGLLEHSPYCGMLPSWASDLMDNKSIAAVKTAGEIAGNFAGNFAENIRTNTEKFLFTYPLTTPFYMHEPCHAPDFCFPVESCHLGLPSAKKTIRFKDSSLALPLAIGFTSLLKKIVVSEKLIATGALAKDGKVLTIGNLEAKVKKAKQNYQKVICPCDNNLSCDNIFMHKIEKSVLIPVSNFKQAWMSFSLYSEKYAYKLQLLLSISDNPLSFIDNIDSLPFEWINSMHREKFLDKIVFEIVNDVELFLKFERKFKSLVNRFQLDKANAAGKLISNVIQIKHIAMISPASALKWCTMNLSLSNHQGDIKASLNWKQKGNTLINEVKSIDINAVSDFFNHCLIAAHNQYHFDYILPDNLIPSLDYHEDQYLRQCSYGCCIDKVLGHLYGTIMQNYAFCGPNYIAEVENYSKKARKALGEGRVAELRHEWLRQYNYLTYARLDAGDIKGAGESLALYMEIKRLEDILEKTGKLSSWQYAVIARFFSQMLERCACKTNRISDNNRVCEGSQIYEDIKTFENNLIFPGTQIFEKNSVCNDNRLYNDIRLCEDSRLCEAVYHSLLSGLIRCCVDCHPWQLVTCNLGRIAFSLNKKKDAAALFKKSIDICFSHKSGHTIRIMALLPISMLVYLKEKEPDALEGIVEINNNKWEKKIRQSADFMDKKYFFFLKENRFEKVIEMVRKKPEFIFPFSYR